MRHFVKKKLNIHLFNILFSFPSIINDQHKWVDTFTSLSIHNKSYLKDIKVLATRFSFPRGLYRYFCEKNK